MLCQFMNIFLSRKEGEAMNWAAANLKLLHVEYLHVLPNNLQGHLAGDQKSAQYELHPKIQ